MHALKQQTHSDTEWFSVSGQSMNRGEGGGESKMSGERRNYITEGKRGIKNAPEHEREVSWTARERKLDSRNLSRQFLKIHFWKTKTGFTGLVVNISFSREY